MTDLTALTIREASEKLASREISAMELTAAYLDRIAAVDGGINAYVALTAEAARRAAAEAEARAVAGERRGPMDGVPVAFKDNIDVAGVATTNGLGPRDLAPPAADAAVVERLKAAGAVILGKLNMQEAAFGGVTDNPHHGSTHNPWKHGHTPGGSSGGSGAAVAAGLSAGGLGSDTMASVRLPAAYCGVVGLKPSYGLISTRGVVPLSWRLDHVGPLTRSVADAGLMLDAMAGYDPESPESIAAPLGAGPYAVMEPMSLKGATVAVIENFETVEAEPAVLAAFEQGLAVLKDLGADIRPMRLPGFDPLRGRRAGLLVIEAEAWVSYAPDMARFPAAYTDELRVMLAYGRDVVGERLVTAERHVVQVGHAFNRLLAEVDYVVSPTAPQVAFPFETAAPVNQSEYMAPANFAGCPALSLPLALSPEGLPIGIQLMAARHAERRLLAAAAALEQAIAFDARPPL